MKPDGTLILSRQDIADLMSFGEYVEAVEDAFRVYADGFALSPGLLDIETQDGAFHIKAAGLKLSSTYVAVKVNGNFPQNMDRYGLPTIQGAITLCDGEMGYPLAFMDSTEITINRTGAATAVGAKYLARADSTVATICGCGKQGRIQLIALKHALPLKSAFAYDINEDASIAFADRMTGELGIPVTPALTLQDAARQSDVIVTCSTSRRAFLSKTDVPSGAFVAAVGADSHDKQELDVRLLASSKIVVDVLDQCATIGELHHAIKEGVAMASDVYAELGEIVARVKSGRISPDEIIILDTTGTAIQDVAAAAIIYERAKNAGVGYSCNLFR